jgi:AcrR family transcriptional regulator
MSLSIAGAPAVRPGRQRSEAAAEAILSATLDVLVETSYAGLTVAAVIERAGVSSATLYRRWTTKQDLVAAAVASLEPEPMDTDTGSLGGDLTAFAKNVAHSVAARREDVAQALNIEKKRNPELAAALRERFLNPRLEQLKGILARARARGEIGTVPPIEVTLSLVIGPIYHRAFHLGEPITPSFVKATVGWARRALTS